MKDNCWKGFKHLWSEEPVKETRTHLLKECDRCHGKVWFERKTYERDHRTFSHLSFN